MQTIKLSKVASCENILISPCKITNFLIIFQVKSHSSVHDEVLTYMLETVNIADLVSPLPFPAPNWHQFPLFTFKWIW